MKKTITLIVFAFGSTLAIAQQDPQFSQYMHNKLFINPGYAGMKKALCLTALFRNQWNGFDGAPNSGTFSADLALPRNGGVGLNVLFDKLGFETTVAIRGNYSFHIPVFNEGHLGLGIEFGGYSKRVGPSGSQQWVATSSWQNDVTIPPLLRKRIMDFGLGIWYQDESKYFGISTTHINGKMIDGADEVAGSTIHTMIYQVARHYFITGGATVYRSLNWTITPSFLVKTDATITSFDVNMNATYRNRFWLGASYRYKDAVCPMAGFIIPGTNGNENTGLKMGFAYDYNTSHLKQYNNGTFEVFLNYCIPVSFIWGTHFDVRNFR